MRTLSLLVLLCLVAACQPTEKAEVKEVPVESPVIANDISNQKITAFAEDAQGHIWVGTFRGLNKYNVHEYHQYFCTDDSLGLPDNQITHLLRDSKNRFWIATVNGICRYTNQDNFKFIPIEANDKNVRQIIEDRKGRIFMNTVSQLYAYDPETEKITCVLPDIDPNHTFHVQCHIDAGNNLWVMTATALYRYDPATLQQKDSIALHGYPYCSYLHNNDLWITGNHTIAIFDTRTRAFKQLPPSIARHPVLRNADINYIHPYGNNGLLLNTAKHGMFYYNPVTGSVTCQGENGFPFEMPRFKVSKIFTDSQQNLWIGSVDQGYTVRYNYKERFNNDNYLRTELDKKSVISLSAGRDNKLWISTLMDGIYIYDTKTREIKHIDPELFAQEKQKDIFVNQLMVDDSDAIWMTTSNNEVLKGHYTPNGQLKIEERHQVHLPMSIMQSPDGTIWIGTATVNIYALRPGEKEFSQVKLFEGFTFVPGLTMIDNSQLMVAGFYQPLKKINIGDLTTSLVDISEEDQKACIRRSVFIPTALHKDTYGAVWIGSVSNGLMCYYPDTGRMIPVPGTSCLDISGIEEDLQGNLWISTQYGLSKYDRTTKHFTNYYAADGIGGNQFYDRASCRLPDGTLVFGGTHGLTFFNPIDVPIKRNIPLLFSDLKIHNQLIRPQQNGQTISEHLSYSPDIHLEHDENSFSLSFSALDYSEYDRVHYQYHLEGFDNYWIDARNNHEAYYANLPAGEYVFHVKITNNDKSIVEAENSIRIIVYPAPWRTWWAYSIYFILATAIVLLFLRALLRIRTEKEAARHARLEKEQEQRLNRMNMSFFANVSHEFRTPLTMISGPVAQLCNAPDITGENKNLLYIVQRSVNRMLKLVNQMMDFNKLENDTLKLKVKRADIIASLQRLVDIFQVNAKNKNITLNTYGLEDTFLLWLDEDKADKIIGNLMSNAMKFTPTGGKISVCFDVITREEAAQLFKLTTEDKDTQYIKIAVANTGQDIPEDKLEKIFERYYQMANQTEGTYNWGTGIGLYYARSLAELHHGHLKASKPNEGSGAVFTLILPVNDLSYTEEEREPEQSNQSEAFPLPANVPYQPEEQTENSEEQKMILVVDDDTEVAHYLNTLLSPHYKIVCRFDAGSALKAMKEEAPDLILSDVVMPGKDGYQLCREVKEDLQLCHIPVILVTAKATVENQVEGLNTGADAYVTKPFEPSYLLALIQSQLKNRENVRSILGKATQVDEIEENVLSPQDNAFMTDLYHLMENEISNPELDIARMTELLKISRTKFYYKVKGLTGENPSIFFKTYKLNRAAELIAEGKYTISEIADITGFSTLSHFSKSFKKQFGVSPSEYHK
jgi:signal transduction histidine kinase/ligand-binding sensor domain-containing protein/DNA-binding response OmpR family regulator